MRVVHDEKDEAFDEPDTTVRPDPSDTFFHSSWVAFEKTDFTYTVFPILGVVFDLNIYSSKKSQGLVVPQRHTVLFLESVCV